MSRQYRSSTVRSQQKRLAHGLIFLHYGPQQAWLISKRFIGTLLVFGGAYTWKHVLVQVSYQYDMAFTCLQLFLHRYPFRSTTRLISYSNESPFIIYVILVQCKISSYGIVTHYLHNHVNDERSLVSLWWFKFSYWNENLDPGQRLRCACTGINCSGMTFNFVLVSCKWIVSHKNWDEHILVRKSFCLFIVLLAWMLLQLSCKSGALAERGLTVLYEIVLCEIWTLRNEKFVLWWSENLYFSK